MKTRSPLHTQLKPNAKFIRSTLNSLKHSKDPSQILENLKSQEYQLDLISKDELVTLLNESYSLIKESGQGFLSFCEFINSSYSIRDVILQRPLQCGPQIIATLSKELQRGILKQSVLLKTLGTFCYSACFNNYKVESAVLSAVIPYCNFEFDEQTCRLAINCIANMLSKSDVAAVPAKEILLYFVELLSSSTKIDSVHTYKLYCNVMRAMQLALPHFPSEELNKVLSLVLTMKRIIYLWPSSESDRPKEVLLSLMSISTEGSDSESNSNTDDFYYNKIKCSALFCLQILFKKYSKQLFSFWPLFLPSFEAPLDTLLSKKSLISLFAQEKSVKVKAAIASTISILIESSPLNTFLTEAPVISSMFSLNQCIKQTISNLFETIPHFLAQEKCTQIECSLIKVSISLLSLMRIEAIDRKHIKAMIKAFFSKISSNDLNLKSALLSVFAALFSERNEEARFILSPQFIQGIFYADDLHSERLQVFEKIVKSFPEVLIGTDMWLIEILSKFINSEDQKVQSSAFDVIEEIIKIGKSLSIMLFVVDLTFKAMQNNDNERMALCFTALSSANLYPMLSISQLEQLFSFIKSLQKFKSNLFPLRCSVLKLIGSFARNSNLPADYFSTIINFTLSHSTSGNQNLYISCSYALSFLCTSKQSLSWIPNITSILEVNSKNKKEKIVSSAIISVGNLFEIFTYDELGDNFPKLLGIVINGLHHKNSKVGWDSCNTLFKFYDFHKDKFYNMSEKLIPILINTIIHHHNYRTRISTCQILRNYKEELYSYDAELLISLIENLESDKDLMALDATVLKYQRYFRQELIHTLMLLVVNRQTLDDAFVNAIGDNLFLIYEWMEKLFEDFDENHDRNSQDKLSEKEWIGNLAKGLGKLIEWIEATDEIQVSFGLAEGLKNLYNVYLMYLNA
ncbi:unnamed protein product [Blepharisma stoltei]|uniref:DUF4042 domain-containing protein n=1 Tax=Blepharisma stoltei TaxID=1481888 RepID=A0AAU9IZZ9_9CILI|nr:unnamed protein product [Blepharisma stoltei]